jgi:hypothetical protein
MNRSMLFTKCTWKGVAAIVLKKTAQISRNALARIIHEPAIGTCKTFHEERLRLSCPKHRACERKRASVRFMPRYMQPAASAVPLMNNPG